MRETKQKSNHSKNVKRYIEGQKAPLEADFLLLDLEAQQEILSNFHVSDIKELLERVTIPQLWALELAILYRLAPSELQRRVWIVREKFQLKCGTDTYRHYYDSLPSSLQEKALSQDSPLTEHQTILLRDDTVSIARQLQRLAYIRISRSESINERKRFIIQATLFIMFLGFVIFQILDSSFNMLISSDEGKTGAKFLLLLVGSGMTGSAVSMLQRIEKASHAPPLITDSIHDTMQITLNMSNWYITSLLVSGAIFALLIHFISIAQLVNVLDFLPNTAKQDISDSIPVLKQLLILPANRVDLAKLLLACFLSGFGERLVPDILDSLIKRAKTVPNQEAKTEK